MFGEKIRNRFCLQEGIAFLNHGSFGATPRMVLEEQHSFRLRMERQPVQFLSIELPLLLRQAANLLATFLHTSGERLVFVENATTAVNTVLAAFPFAPGDEMVVSRHIYPAVRNTALAAVRRCGVRLVEIDEPFPADEATLVGHWQQGLSERSKLVILDHVASPTAVVHPIEQVIALCRSRGIPVLVDGAHAPGMLPLDLEQLAPDWYAGNCHKWLFAPKGCGFLWQSDQTAFCVSPLVVSVRADRGFPLDFDWTGTKDPSAWLAVGAALAFHQELSDHHLWAYQRELLQKAVTHLVQCWSLDWHMAPTQSGSMATLPLPPMSQTIEAIHHRLWNEFGVEVPVLAFDARQWVRLSVQAYNTFDDYQRLGSAILQMAKQ